MLRRILLVFSFVVAGTVLSFAQTGSLHIKMFDKATNEPMPFASVVVEQNGTRVGAGQTNIDGDVQLTALAPGKYDVKATFVGYTAFQQTGVIVSADKVTYLKFGMTTGVDLNAVIVTGYQAPLVSGDVTSGSTVTRDQFKDFASKDISVIASTTAGINSTDGKGSLSVRGSREDAVTYYVDGVRVIGGLGVSQLGVEQITTITGGIPAQYGDVTGGVISITTRGVQPNLFGSIQAESSQYLDQFGHNLVGFNLGTPIYSVRDTAGNKKPVVGLIVSGEYIYNKDPYPTSIGTYKVKDDVLSGLESTPLRPSATGGFLRNAEFVTMNDLEKIQYHQNVAQNGINLNGKLQFRISDNTDFSVAGNYSYRNSLGYDNGGNYSGYYNSLFNPTNNTQYTSNTARLSGRLTQRFNTKTEAEKEKTTALITNAVFTLQGEYSKSTSVSADQNLKDDFFQYGYVGKFDRIEAKYNNWYAFDQNGNGQYAPNYTYKSYRAADGTTKYGYVQNGGFGDSLIRFTPNSSNQNAANYTSEVYRYRNNTIHSNSEIQSGLGLLNGDNPGNVYSLWSNTGAQNNGYSTSSTSNYRVSTSFSAVVKNHNIQVGFEYEQRVSSGYSIAPASLWTLMRQLTNKHLTELDTMHPHVANMGTYDYITYDRKYDAASQSEFDKNLRKQLGLAQNSTTIINTDGLDPKTLSLGMFSPDELLNQGSSLVTYYGYDYTGKALTGSNPSFDGFFNDKDPNGNFKRQIGAFEPIYVAGYIQDQFDIEDLKIRLGLRIDRYDANQKVLKDKYSLYEIKTAGEVANLGAQPSSIGSNYAVYVDDVNNPTKIVGYRNGDNWYSPQGSPVNDPKVLMNSANLSKMYPYLVDPASATSGIISPKAFKDYQPQNNLMPRVAFAFPINDRAQFNANYDITTQRPTFGTNLALPTEYLTWANNQGQSPFIANAGLLPQRTTNYELGFTQVLNEKKNAALTISAFYKELRNMIQYKNVVQAYPAQYITYDNIDFATVKGLSLGFDLRRTHNIQFNANYTLQFANGTGSNANEGANLVTAGAPNLRSLIPLSYDRRHQFNLVLDYRFANGPDYNGPSYVMHKGKENERLIKLLQGVGFNLTFQAGSGLPYSRQTTVTQDVAVGIVQRSTLQGSINGSNLPWTYRFDFKVDKNMKVTWRAEKDGKSAKTANLNVYVVCLNLFDTQNIIGVYKYTGNAKDDGFLSSPAGQTYASAQVNPASFTDMYTVKVNNPAFYSIPRSIRLGFIMDF